MYKCDDCGHLFEDGGEKIMHENMGECHGAPAWEVYAVCPMCGGTFSIVEPCKVCGSYDVPKRENFCASCEKDIQRRVEAFLDREFSAEEKELFEKIYGNGVY